MKKVILILTLIFAVNISTAQSETNTVIGKWIGTDSINQTGGIEFLKSGKAIITKGEETLVADYKVNYEKDPIAIKLATTANGQTLIMYGLIKFIDTETIKWEIFPFANKQPIQFSNNADTSVILTRSVN